MSRGQRSAEDGQRSLVKRLGLLGFAARFVQHGQIVQCHRHVRMVGSAQFFFDRQRAPVKRLRLRQFTTHLMDGGEIIQNHRDVGMFRPVDAFENRKSAPIKPFRFVVASLPIDQPRQRGHVRRRLDVLRAEQPFPHLNRAARIGLARGETAARVFQSAEVMPERRTQWMIAGPGLFQKVKGPVIGSFRFLEMAVVFAEHAELVKDRGQSERGAGLFCERERFRQKQSRLRVATLFAELAALSG